MKAGTTSLHNYLDEHPDIAMSAYKELDFFCAEKTWNRGVEWYVDQFDDAPVRGESSPGYTKHPAFSGVPERMVQIIPDAKLVYLVRDPIDRIVSHYVDSYSFGRESGTLDEVMADLDDNHYVNCSRYDMQLSQYDGFYPPERILVVTSEALKLDRTATLQTVFRFLDVDATFVSPAWDEEYWTGASKTRKTRLGYLLAGAASAVNRTKVRSYLPDFLGAAIRGFNEKTGRPIERPTVSPDLRARLTTALAEDMAAFRVRTGMTFDEWSV